MCTIYNNIDILTNAKATTDVIDLQNNRGQHVKEKKYIKKFVKEKLLN